MLYLSSKYRFPLIKLLLVDKSKKNKNKKETNKVYFCSILTFHYNLLLSHIIFFSLFYFLFRRVQIVLYLFSRFLLFNNFYDCKA